MTVNNISDDLRSRKTKKALNDAMFSLLRKRSFRRVTVKEICEEALISRAAFYTHYVDKYDLFKHWLVELWPNDIQKHSVYEQIEQSVNTHIKDNAVIIKNVMLDADDETAALLFEFFMSTISLDAEKYAGNENPQRSVVLSHFYAGGIISYLLWQVKNRFPPDIPIMNRYFFDMIRELQSWKS